MRKTMFVLMLGVLAGCGVSEKEAKEALEGVETIATAPADMRVVLLGSMCFEAKSCAGDCKEVMEAIGKVDPKDRMLLIAQCDTTIKPIPETDGAKAFSAWMKKRVGEYLAKVRKALPEGEQARLDKAWTTLQADT